MEKMKMDILKMSISKKPLENFRRNRDFLGSKHNALKMKIK